MPVWKILCALLVLGLSSPAANAQQARVYKWVDGSGTTHYTDRPPDGAMVVETGIRFSRTDPAAIQSGLTERAELRQAAQTREDQQAEAAAEEQMRREESREQRATLCQQAQERVEKYETAHRLYRPLPDGGREYLSDAELDAERAEARRSVDEWCD